MFLQLFPIFDRTDYAIQFTLKISYLDSTIFLASHSYSDCSTKHQKNIHIIEGKGAVNLNMRQDLPKKMYME
jgi:hypothetical protein